MTKKTKSKGKQSADFKRDHTKDLEELNRKFSEDFLPEFIESTDNKDPNFRINAIFLYLKNMFNLCFSTASLEARSHHYCKKDMENMFKDIRSHISESLNQNFENFKRNEEKIFNDFEEEKEKMGIKIEKKIN